MLILLIGKLNLADYSRKAKNRAFLAGFYWLINTPETETELLRFYNLKATNDTGIDCDSTIRKHIHKMVKIG